MTTKAQHVNSAYSQLRISGLTVQPTPEDNELALWRLEDMMADLYGRTLDLGYVFEETPDANTQSGVDKVHRLMISANLAIQLLPDFGKVATMELANLARSSYSASSAVVARERLRGVNYPTRMPIGSGNSRFGNRYRRFYNKTTPPVTDASNVSMFKDDSNSFSESFVDYLKGDTIASYTIQGDSGLTISGDALNADSNILNYTVTPTKVGALNIVIVATTNDGRVETRERLFEVAYREIA